MVERGPRTEQRISMPLRTITRKDPTNVPLLTAMMLQARGEEVFLDDITAEVAEKLNTERMRCAPASDQGTIKRDYYPLENEVAIYASDQGQKQRQRVNQEPTIAALNAMTRGIITREDETLELIDATGWDKSTKWRAKSYYFERVAENISRSRPANPQHQLELRESTQMYASAAASWLGKDFRPLTVGEIVNLTEQGVEKALEPEELLVA